MTTVSNGDGPLDEPLVALEDRNPAEVVGDQAMGLELQLIEVVEQIKRAETQERWDDLRSLRVEEARLDAELARTAEAAGHLAE